MNMLEVRQPAEAGYFIGELLFIIFQSEEENFTIAKFKVIETNEDFEDKEIVAKGYFANLQENMPYTFYGSIEHHPTYGMQYNVNSYQMHIPDHKTGLIDYLSSDMFHGIGPKTAMRIVEKLGEKAIDKILMEPEVLEDIPHLTKKAKEHLISTLQTNQGFENIVTQLSKYNIGLKVSQRIFEKYKEEAYTLIQKDPYQFVFTIDGFGFKTADQIAFHHGLSPTHDNRIRAGCLYVLQESVQEGHVFLPLSECISQVKLLLNTHNLEDEVVTKGIQQLRDEEYLIIRDEKVYLPSLYYAEKGIINHLQRIMKHKVRESVPLAELMKLIGEIEEEEKINYGTDQFEAIQKALQSKIMILTGGPGTGKTTVIKGILKAYAKYNDISYDITEYEDQSDYPFLLAAPTGRAAKRLEQSTGLPATTIHRLLGWNGEDFFEKNEYEPLEGKFLIVDEFSMVDVWLANHLFQAIPGDMQVLFVGDKAQLPSVGPGQVLSDLLNSKLIPTASLKNVYRQKEGSKIIELAHHIKNNTLTKNFLSNAVDFSFITCHQPQVIGVLTQIFKRAQEKGINVRDIQVLAPMYRGEVGINQINEHLQEIVNPKSSGKREKKIFDATYRINDKVIQLVNQPEDGVSNGDIGEIVAIFHKSETADRKEHIVIKFDDREVVYYREDYQNFMHAYCISIHKAQGSEFPIVILPIVSSYHRMLRKNLIYTAITRATTSLILCGEKDAFLQGIQTVDYNQRNSTLLKKLSLLYEDDEQLSPYDFLD